jgi:hypothetical protein
VTKGHFTRSVPALSFVRVTARMGGTETNDPARRPATLSSVGSYFSDLTVFRSATGANEESTAARLPPELPAPPGRQGFVPGNFPCRCERGVVAFGR